MINKVKNELFEEEYYEFTHSSGLRVFVMPKKDFTTSYAGFITKFGSINNKFSVNGEVVSVPDGTAHFLEHKLFESDEVDAFEKFSKTGAKANAFTTFDRTCYLFSCSENVYENLEILLDFVQNPYFTEQTVQKEQGIIGQEIKMYQDSPGYMVTFNLLKSIYHNHPIKIDIAGSVESIAEITAEKLYKCYDAYYNLNNMALAVTGNIEPEKVLEICDKMLKPAEPCEVKSIFDDEPDEVVCNKTVEEMPVSVPLFSIGYKERYEGVISVPERIATAIICESIAGGVAPLYQRLIEDNTVYDFGWEYLYGDGYASVIFQGAAQDPELVKRLLDEEIERIKKEGITEELYHCIVKELYGDVIMGYNDIEENAQDLLECALYGVDFFEKGDYFRKITLDEINLVLKDKLDISKSALSIIKPVEDK